MHLDMKKSVDKLTAFILAVVGMFLLVPENVGAQTDSRDGQNQARIQGQPRDLSSLSLEDLMRLTIESVSKFAQELIDAPATVNIVTRDDIKNFGFRTLSDVLNSVPGVVMRNDRNYSYVGVRGLNPPGDFNSRFLLLLDGHRLNDAIYNQAALGNDTLIDIDMIERVEVIRGPASSLYGADAFLGIINIRTRRAADIRGLEVSGDADTFSSFNGRVTYGDRFSNGLEVIAAMSRYGSDGDSRLFFREFDSPETNNGIAMNADAERATRFYGSLSYGDVSLAGGLVRRTKIIPTAPYDTIFNTDQTFTDDDRSFASARIQHTFANQLRVTGRVYFDDYLYVGHYPYDASEENEEPLIVNNQDLGRAKTVGVEWQGAKRVNRQTVVVGGEFRRHYRQNQKNGDQYPGPGQFFDEYLNIKTTSTNWALFAQNELKVSQDVTLTGGIRYDSYSSFGGKASPRLAVVYRAQSSTTLKALYGGAFRAPGAYELDYADGGRTQKGNPDLQPETMQSLEFSAQRSFGPNVTARLNFYSQAPEHLIRLAIDPLDELLVFENGGAVKQRGVEWELEGLIDSGLRGRFSYAFQRTTDRDSGAVVANSPDHLVKFAATVPLVSDVSLSFEGRYVSSRQTISDVTTPGYFVMNVTLFSRSLTRGLELSGGVYNIFNKEVNDPGGWEHVQDYLRQDGRTGRLKLTYKF